MRAAVVGGGAYYAGKKVQQGRQQDQAQEAAIADAQEQQYQAQAASPAAPAAPASAEEGMADQLAKLKSLADSGVLTQDEFAAAKQKIIQGG